MALLNLDRQVWLRLWYALQVPDFDLETNRCEYQARRSLGTNLCLNTVVNASMDKFHNLIKVSQIALSLWRIGQPLYYIFSSGDRHKWHLWLSVWTDNALAA